MDLTLDGQDLEFQQEFEAWLQSHPPVSRPHHSEDWFAWRVDWQRCLASGGWASVHWPSAYGGRDATLAQVGLYYESLANAGAPLPANLPGLFCGGPTVIDLGTVSQRERWLSAIVDASEIWCQGFSEPGIGSDLARLRTKAMREAGGWRIHGQKVWTTEAHNSTWCMVLARTDPDAPHHKGITYFIMEMDQPEVRTVPLRQASGEYEFCEVFLDGAWVSDDQVIGSVGGGWAATLNTLSHERGGQAVFFQMRTRQLFDSLVDEVRKRGWFSDQVIADRIAKLYTDLETTRLCAQRALTAVEGGVETSLTKLWWSEVSQAITSCAIDLLGADAYKDGQPWEYEFLRARANSIEGGTSEIQRSLVAERMLKLPRSR